jgi:hypothetical protein
MFRTLETLLHKITKLLSNNVYAHQSTKCMAVRHSVQKVPQVTCCGTQLSNICKRFSDAKYENLYINHHMHPKSHQFIIPSSWRNLELCTRPFRTTPNSSVCATTTEMADKRKRNQLQGDGSFSSHHRKVGTHIMLIIFLRICNNYNEIYIYHGYILYSADITFSQSLFLYQYTFCNFE